MNLSVDDGERGKAVARVMALLNVRDQDKAGALVDGVLAGAVDQALELMNGSGPVPTTMITAKADQVRFVCNRVERMLTQQEVEVVLRITSLSARAIITMMNATYAEALRSKRLEWMHNGVHITPSGSDDAGLTWTLQFSEGSTLETAWIELQRVGLGNQCIRDDSKLTLTFAQEIDMGSSGSIDGLTVLGLSRPSRPRSKRR